MDKPFACGLAIDRDVRKGQRNPPDGVGTEVRKPDISVRSRCYLEGRSNSTIGDTKLSHNAAQRDSPDLLPVLLDEPQVAVWARCDAARSGARRRHGELSNRSTRCNPA